MQTLPAFATSTSLAFSRKPVIVCYFHSLEHHPVLVPCRASPCYRQWPTSPGRERVVAAAPAGGSLPSSPRTRLHPGPGSDSPGRPSRERPGPPGSAGRATAAGWRTVPGVWSWCWRGRRGVSSGHWTGGTRWADMEAGSTGAGNPNWSCVRWRETGCRGAGWRRAGEAAGGSHCCFRRAFPAGQETDQLGQVTAGGSQRGYSLLKRGKRALIYLDWSKVAFTHERKNVWLCSISGKYYYHYCY